MKIKEIKFKNMISHENEVSFNFLRKYKDEEKNRFFDNTINLKSRSNYKEGIIKNVALIGKNAAYKTSTMTSINLMLDFIINFRLNAKKEIKQKINIHKIIEWYYKENNSHPIKVGISKKKLIEKYLFYINKKKNIENINFKEFEIKYLKFFYKKYSFNDEKPILFNLTIYDEIKNEEYIYDVSLIVEKNEVFSSCKLNNEEISLFDEKNDEILSEIKHYFYSKTNLFNESKKHFLNKALEFFIIEIYSKNTKKMIEFLKILDPSIMDIKYIIYKDEETNVERFYIQSFTRQSNQTTQINVGINKLSTGTQIFIINLYIILKNNFIIIDEIEQSLHFKLVKLILNIASNKNKQIIYSTHSPIILEKLAKKDEIYISKFCFQNKLEIIRADKIFRNNNNFISKYLNDLVSNITDHDLNKIKSDFYD